MARTIQSKLRLPWIVSYNAHARLIRMYAGRRYFRYSLQYSAMRSYEGKEVFIFADGVHLPETSKLAYVAQGLANLRAA
ncbi:MAG: hypothetical protein Q8K82_05585 [Gemmatimonadaceae bacterium]|nr:hypothetical protein [Gemmatimonadaceae bacterium]